MGIKKSSHNEEKLSFREKRELSKHRRKYAMLYPDLLSDICNISYSSTPNEDSKAILSEFLSKYKEIPSDSMLLEAREHMPAFYWHHLFSMDMFFKICRGCPAEEKPLSNND